MQTKSCNLTEDEISTLIADHGAKLSTRDFSDEDVDRINYLNKRLKAFKEVEITADTDATNPANQQVKSDNSAAGWGSQ